MADDDDDETTATLVQVDLVWIGSRIGVDGDPLAGQHVLKLSAD